MMATRRSVITVADAKKVIDEVVSALQNNGERQLFSGKISEIDITEVFKGGSLGKGTMVPGDFDVDLVIFSRSLLISGTGAGGTGGTGAGGTGNRVDYRELMTEYDQYLRTQLRPQDYVKKGINDHSLQFKYCDIAVDLLISPYFENKQQYYGVLERISKESISLLSCSSSKWQVEFVQSYSDVVLEYIRRAKAWRNNAWDDDESGRPSSYLVELLVIKAYENGGKQIHQNKLSNN